MLSRATLTDEVVKCLPEGHTVNLEDPEMFILIEVFKVRGILLASQGLMNGNLCRVYVE